ncbi:hypothetical protein BFN03_16840 [Rhodococcus sp. WMMA185]|uniref:hypothetical protein n=1 Tax=Rhodococcus sp. WMMA185 TaxID=679318 RepID=UPI00087817F3|nr:hypothetical protein [Rhodococcus sp. WMMA185]AOW93755.1 hypothetical protein BFN03_16840 [Rhodococcus sp. WMMA185]
MSKTSTIVKRIAGGGIALAAATAFAAPGIASAESGSSGSAGGLGIGSLAVGSLAAGSLALGSLDSGSGSGNGSSGSGSGGSSGSSGSDGGVLPPLVEAEVVGNSVSMEVENPNIHETYCGAILFKADTDITDFNNSVWSEGFDMSTWEWTREGETRTYTVYGLEPGDYIVTADCAVADGVPVAIDPIEVTVEEATGFLGSLGLDSLFDSLGSSGN